MKRWQLALAFLLLGACAEDPGWVWVRNGATQQDFSMDSGQCKAQAFSAPGMPTIQVVLIYHSCMQGKGWYQTAPEHAGVDGRPQPDLSSR